MLVLSHDVFNDRPGTVIAMVLTSPEPRAGFLLTLERKAAGLTKRSWIKSARFERCLLIASGQGFARASEEELARVLDGLNEILG